MGYVKNAVTYQEFKVTSVFYNYWQVKIKWNLVNESDFYMYAFLEEL